jgi:Flp pilus assembly protein TadD
VRNRFLASLAAIGLSALLVPPALAQATCTAEGFVFDGQGNPIAEVDVLLQYKGHNPQKYRTKTDRKGKFVHVNVYEGTYDLTFSKPGAGEVTVKDFRIREISSLEKTPTFRLGGGKPASATAEAGPAGSATPTGGAEPVAGTAGQAAASAAAAGAPPAAADPVALTAELQKADAALGAGRTDEAIAAYELVLASAPRSAPVHHNLGLAYRRKGDLGRAEAEFRKAVELEPGLAASHGALSLLMAAAGKLDEAVAQAREAASQAPADAQYAYNLGVLLKDAGQAKDAREALLRAEALDPANAEIQFHLGTVELALGQTDAAVGRLEKYVAAAPTTAPNVAIAKGIIAAVAKK